MRNTGNRFRSTRLESYRSLFLPAAAGLALAVPAVLTGCGGDLRAIDEQVDAAMKERSAKLGLSAYAPTRARAVEDKLDNPSNRNTDLPTRNPGPEEIALTPANEARDVAARLAGYATAPAENTMKLNLLGVMRQLQTSGRAFLSAEEEYVVAAIGMLVVEHRWTPQLTASTGVNVVNTDRRLDAGNYQTPMNIINTLKATQRLPFGGTAEAAWVWDATETLRAATTERYTQSSNLILQAAVPLLRGAGDVAREDLISARRNLIYAARTFEQRRRELLVDIATDYFNLIEQQAVIANQERSLEFAVKQQERTQALVEAGRAAEFQLGISASEVLSSRSSLANLRERYILAVEQFKIKLGLPVNQPIAIEPLAFDLKEPETAPDAAATTALEYSLDLQNQRDQLEDSVRQVRNARNALLPDAQLSGGVTMRTDPNVRDPGVVYNDNDFVYRAGVLVNWPLDRKEEQYALRTANIRLAQAQRGYEQARDRVIIDARARVRELDLARFNLELAEQRVKIALRRREEQEIKAAEVTAQQFVETAQEIREAENARDRAIAGLRTTILNYLLTTGQLRVDRDGTLLPPPGLMGNAPVDPAAVPPPPPMPAAETAPTAAPAPAPGEPAAAGQ